jgi:hypothetical protein
VIFTPCGGRPASRVIEVPSSVRLDPPPHPFWPCRRRTDELPVTKNNNAASARRTKRVEFQKTRDDLYLQLRELQAEGRREQDRFCNSPIAEPTHPDSLAYHDFLDRMEKVAEQIGFIETALQVLDGLPKYGRKAKDEWYDDLLDECLNDAGRVKKDVRRLFLERAMDRRRIQLPSAVNKWTAAWNRRFPDGAPGA